MPLDLSRGPDGSYREPEFYLLGGGPACTSPECRHTRCLAELYPEVPDADHVYWVRHARECAEHQREVISEVECQ